MHALSVTRGLFAALTLTLFTLAPLIAQAQSNELPSVGLAPHASGGYAPDAVIVKFRPSANASNKARARGLVNAVANRQFKIVKGLEKLKLKKGQSVNQAVNRLKKLPFVEYAEPDYLVQKATNDEFYGLVYAIENTGQDIRGVAGTPDADMDVLEAWTIQTGDPNLIIAVIDEGVQWDHPDLANNMWRNQGEVAGNGIDDDGNGFVDDVYGYDFYGNDGDPMDEGGHGTHVAGTICAEANNGIGIVGVVHQCKIMALRFLGPQGGSTSDGIASIDYAVQMGAKISNNSWGGGGFSQALYDSIAAARDADHIFLAAAGNGGSDGIGDNNDGLPHYPSNYNLPNVISVAATDNNDDIAGFSNYGATSVDIGAPGVDIASTYINDGYVWQNGTSMATPNVTGVVALIRSEFPDWNYQQVIDHLYSTARPAASMAGITTTGGIANAQAAMAGGEPPTPPEAPSALSAAGLSDSAINLTWSDNSDNESVFIVERDGQVLSSTVSANATSFEDSGLAGATTYSYRVKARNSAGDSAWSNSAEATTDTPPPYQTVVASSETTVAGTIVSGNYTRTFDLDGSLEQIRERESGGKRNRRYSYMDHRWTLASPSGAASLSVTGFSGNSSDGDQFQLAYSTGGGFTNFCTLPVGASSTCSTSFELSSAATITVRVVDTNQARGARALDSVYIDQIQLFVESNTGPVTLPAAPSGLTGDASTPGQITLAWADNADNETSYTVQRSDVGGSWSTIASLGANSDAFTDSTVESLTTYNYRVLAGNSAGDSTSDSIQLTSAEQVAPNITLSASGYKTKGWQNVDASWDAAGTPVVLYRNTTSVYSGSGSSFTDARISKGGAVYDYQVCPQGEPRGSGNCSDVVRIVF
jgi:subtilisin family serine protease